LGTTGFDTEAALGNDVLQPWVSINKAMAENVPEGTVFQDEFGITWKREGYYNMVVEHPLEQASAEDIRLYPLPDPLEEARFRDLEDLLARFGASHFIGADVSGSLFEPAYHLRNMEKLLFDLAMGSQEAAVLFDRLMQFTTEVALACIKREVDWIWLGDDVGTQSGMLLSPEMWRKWLKPRMQNIIQALRAAQEDLIIVYHSCGSIRPIIGDLVEIGIDVLNPLQPRAADMDNAEIKQEFGSSLCFMAGIDTQSFLQQASPLEVREETERILEVMGEGSGFIFAGSHTIQPDVPRENIEAMLEVLDDSEGGTR